VPRVCTVCANPQRQAIDAELLSGSTYRTIADRTGLSETALKRHKADHLPKHVAQAKEAAEVAIADDLLTQLKALRNRAISILTKAEHAGDYRTALQGIREARGCIETLLEVEGELDRRGVTNIVVQAEWLELRTVILSALQPYPDARVAVAGALGSIEGGAGHAAD
jgi:hypothetical protein